MLLLLLMEPPTTVLLLLQHGTVVTWDAHLVCHCTAVPTIKMPDAEVYGTYFGVTKAKFEGELAWLRVLANVMCAS